MNKADELNQVIQRIAAELETTSVPRDIFRRKSGVSEREVQRLFGSYNGLVEAAGLDPRSFPTSDAPVYSDQQLLDEVVRVFRLPGARLTRVFFERNAQISASACERRFGGWLSTVKAAAGHLKPEVDTDLLELIREYTTPAILRTRPSPTLLPITGESDDPSRDTGSFAHELIPALASNVYGDFINFRGLQHAPVNEQGVVFLFGMICRELGYVVEIVKPGFPDCEAKRNIRRKLGLWQRVRIEFEFQCRNFKVHGHDPDQCDVIVCWEDNWPECPIEVLELRPALRHLSSIVTQE